MDGPGSDSTRRSDLIQISINPTKEESYMQPNNPNSEQDEAEIHRLIAEWSAALEAKDLDGLTAGYLPDSIP